MAKGNGVEDSLDELRRSLTAIPEVIEPPKSTLRILGSTRSETNWNTILAYFLDPAQPHGFGADLLKAFLDQANDVTDTEIEYLHRDIDMVEVDTEVESPHHNRPDILIRAPGAWFVCIESKVEAMEGERQTQRYVEDSHLGHEEKSEYPLDGHHYLFLSRAYAPDANADGFNDLYWEDVIGAFHDTIRRSHGRYPERSAHQLEDFLTTVTQVTSMQEDDFTRTQKEKVQLLSEYRDDIDELLEAADSLRQRSLEEWPNLFLRQVDEDLWTEDWHAKREPLRAGAIFRDGWYLDDKELNPTTDHAATQGPTGFRLHFVHLIRRQESFTRGELTYILRSPTSVDLRDEFNSVYNADRWQRELQPLLEEWEITNKGNMLDYTVKTYDVDQYRLPESYFETLAFAFEEHLPLADVVDDILNEALANVRSDTEHADLV